jgi:hypothetical protein
MDPRPLFTLEESESAQRYHRWAAELRAIEVRKHANVGDYTRAAVLRSCMRAEQGGC